MSNVAAAGFCPFISASGSSLFGFDDWTELSKPRDLEKVFDSLEITQNGVRLETVMILVSLHLTMPRVFSSTSLWCSYKSNRRVRL